MPQLQNEACRVMHERWVASEEVRTRRLCAAATEEEPREIKEWLRGGRDLITIGRQYRNRPRTRPKLRVCRVRCFSCPGKRRGHGHLRTGRGTCLELLQPPAVSERTRAWQLGS